MDTQPPMNNNLEGDLEAGVSKINKFDSKTSASSVLQDMNQRVAERLEQAFRISSAAEIDAISSADFHQNFLSRKIASLANENKDFRMQLANAEFQLAESAKKIEALRKAMASLKKDKDRYKKTSDQVSTLYQEVSKINRKLRQANEKLEKRSNDDRRKIRDIRQKFAVEYGHAVSSLLEALEDCNDRSDVSLEEKARIFLDKNIIDPVWYLERHKDVAEAGADAATHYILHGAQEGRFPKPTF